ncbi:MAG: exonuclease [Spirochaetia bacterium]|nr:exonuclease [Spirochaetia bacterium]
MSYIIVDVESDGPFPESNTGYSMVCFGAIVVEPSLSKTFYGQTRPISSLYQPNALAISGFSREQHEKFDDPIKVMNDFSEWIKTNSKGHPIMISDNIAYDWMFINFYLHKFVGSNIFGYSGRRISDVWAGYNNNMYVKWKHLRKTSHTHNPVDDAKGNAEALLEMQRQGLKIKLT